MNFSPKPVSTNHSALHDCKGSNTIQKCSAESLMSVISAVSLTQNLFFTDDKQVFELSTTINMFFLSFLKFTVNTTVDHNLRPF